MAGGSKQKMKPKKVETVFGRVDLRDNKTISPEDLMEAVIAFGGDVDLGGARQMCKQLYGNKGDCGTEELRQDFYRYDKDKDGLLSAKELKVIVSSMISNEVTLKDCQAMIKSVDSNGDGLINFEEYRKVMTIPFSVFRCDNN